VKTAAEAVSKLTGGGRDMLINNAASINGFRIGFVCSIREKAWFHAAKPSLSAMPHHKL
jgi:hypothetical protein